VFNSREKDAGHEVLGGGAGEGRGRGLDWGWIVVGPCVTSGDVAVVIQCVCTPVKILFRLRLQKFVLAYKHINLVKHGLTPILKKYTKI
jgi:hypothetical protein